MADEKKDKGGKSADKAPKAPKAEKAAKAPDAAKGGKGVKKGGAAAAVGAVSMERPTGPKEKPRLAKQYEETVRPALMERFKYTSVMQAPRLMKIVINMGVGDALQDQKLMDSAVN